MGEAVRQMRARHGATGGVPEPRPTGQKALRIRDFRTDDYPAVARIGNAVWPDLQVTPHELAARDRRWIGRTQRRRVVEVGGEVVGFSLAESDGHEASGRHFRLNVAVLPAFQRHGLGAALLAETVAWLDERQAIVHAEVREHQPAGRSLLERQGFSPAARWPVSRLDVQAFEDARFAATAERVRAAGIHIDSLAVLRARDPGALERLHALRWAIGQEVAGSAPAAPEPLEHFVAYFDNPSALPDGWLVAHTAEQYLGLTTFWASAADPTRLHTGLTGVVPALRRQGIAMALKVAGVAYARQRGARYIETDNEENNPMYRLNLQLGFEPQPAWLVYRRDPPVRLP